MTLLLVGLGMIASGLVAGFVGVTLDAGLTAYSIGKDNSKPSAFNAAPAGAVVTGPGDYFAINQRSEKGTSPYSVTWFVNYPGAAPATINANLESCSGDPTNPNEWFVEDSTTTVANNVTRRIANLSAKFLRINITVLTTPAGGVIAGFTLG